MDTICPSSSKMKPTTTIMTLIARMANKLNLTKKARPIKPFQLIFMILAVLAIIKSWQKLSTIALGTLLRTSALSP